MPSYIYDRQFRIKILSLMLNDFWMMSHGSGVIKPEYFEQHDEISIAKAIMHYRSEYHTSPRDPDDIIVLAGAEGDGVADLVYELYDDTEYDTRLASDMVVQFAKEQAVRLAILDSIDDLQNGNLKAPLERMKEAVITGDMLTSPGLDPIKDIQSWLYDTWSDKVPTRLSHLDRALEGGLGVPELGIVLAPPNRGKSMMLVNIGYGAASIGSGLDVVHFTHEMSPAKVAKRYAARIMFRFPKLDEDLQQYEQDLYEAARRLVPGRIRIIGGARKMSLEDMDAHLQRLVAEGFNIGLIVDDYPDLMTPPRKYNERRFELSAIYEMLRDMSERYHCPVWGASQSTRSSLSKEIITMEDVAEDIGKAAVSDVMVALCQTQEEQQSDRCRLFLAKARDSGKRKGLLFASKYFEAQQAIITTGIVSMKKEQKSV